MARLTSASKARNLEFFGAAWSSVGYCDVEFGCKYALSDLPGSNGITRAPNDTLYVTSTTRAELRALSRRSDNTLEVKDIVRTGTLFRVTTSLVFRV